MVSFSVIVTRCVTVTEPVASAAPFARSTVSVGVALVVLVVVVLSIGMTTSVSRGDVDDDDDDDDDDDKNEDFEFVVVVVVGRGNVVRVIGGTVKLLLGRCLKKGSRWVVVGSSVTGGNTVG